jgi:hypothetical protein
MDCHGAARLAMMVGFPSFASRQMAWQSLPWVSADLFQNLRHSARSRQAEAQNPIFTD